MLGLERSWESSFLPSWHPLSIRNVSSTIPGKSFEVVKHSLNQESIPKKANAEVEFKRTDQRITIQSGATIYKIAIDVYGANTGLGMDLIKEFNPEIENLNWVAAGQDLRLPSLTRETLLRQHSDGSYHLIVASFRRLAGAEEHARLLRSKGYRVTITPRPVSDDLVLHRVEIDGLKNLEEANQIWQTGLTNQWLAFAGNPAGPGRQADKISGQDRQGDLEATRLCVS